MLYLAQKQIYKRMVKKEKRITVLDKPANSSNANLIEKFVESSRLRKYYPSNLEELK